jgi:hypothetical protein
MRTYACDQWHSSRESTALIVATINHVETLKVVAWDRHAAVVNHHADADPGDPEDDGR